MLSRRVEAKLPQCTPNVIRAELARVRAQRSWLDWDDEEREWEATARQRLATSS
jgi:hypothetical protein